ncbi:hypothetical protein JMA_03890 [Jeotgalibacillus malaysiensis]|uniref:Glycosyltransferase 2-like domain-containing protein n=1 Tax=Jeotgalibacillus malaysiensis TaxID=1508404 RepID=A0A0B5AI05_9BACL|nr:hypothetical protein [Jeotgalibacillus malaysiensis]AJD89706.1 hypothetical protein JMA_03890 [Jeotgalibacillus malaysiensis]
MTSVDLLTVTHDPEGRLLSQLQQYEQVLADLYHDCWITVSDQSSEELIQYLLYDSQFNVEVIPKHGAANARRAVVEFGLASESTHFHYCDLDRLITWMRYHQEELHSLIRNIPQSDYLIIGRTDKAMSTHPESWIETEKITNKICSFKLGKEVDITAGSCAFSHKICEMIQVHSEASMTDAEWMMIAQKQARTEIDVVEVDGLEYHEALNAPNKSMKEVEQWFSRLRLSMVISETIIKQDFN